MNESAIIEFANRISHGCYNAPMELVNYPDTNYAQIGAKGDCPHCAVRSLFQPVLQGYTEFDRNTWRICNPAQCQACKQFVLLVGFNTSQRNARYSLIAVYPLGKPNDSVDEAVLPQIRSDFSEALRCRWVDAYKAAVTMCRRALQVSAIDKGAKGSKLIDQIDDLRVKGVITEPLKEMAHEIRLTGNDGAHPDKDGLADVTAEDADDIIEFTREYLHHVYVMPAKLAARRPAAAAAAQPAQPRP